MKPVMRNPIRRIYSALAILLLLTSVVGCATRQEVQSIVDESNRMIIDRFEADRLQSELLAVEAMAGELASPNAAVKPGDAWQQASNRIDEFIANHPDQVTTNNVLRVRQAMLLLAHGQNYLAEQAFDLVDVSANPPLVTERDKALYAQRAHIVWWFAANGRVLAPEQAKAQAALDSFKSQVQALAPGSEIGHYLAEMRAWIAYAWAEEVIDPDANTARLKDGLDTLLDRHSDASRAWMKDNPGVIGGGIVTFDDDVPLLDLRHRLRTLRVIKAYRQTADEQDISPSYKYPWVGQIEFP